MNNNENLTIKEVFNFAVKNHQENKTDIAKDFYNQVLKTNPNHIAALNNIGIIFQELREYQKAKDCYKKAIEINPNYKTAYNNLGFIFQELKENQKAKDCYEKAIEIDPNYADAHNNLGNIFQELKENQKAKNCYEKAIEIKPNYADAHCNLGKVFIELGENQKAKDCYEKAIEINPNHIAALNNIGIIFQELKENQKAKNCYEKAIEINPNYTEAHNNLGNVFLELGENQKGINCYEKAITINPNDVNTYNNIGISFKELEDNQKALYYFKKAIAINPESIRTINNITQLFKTIKISKISKEEREHYKELFIILFRSNNLDHNDLDNNVILFFFPMLGDNQIQQAIISKSSLLANEIIRNSLKDELLHLTFQKSLISGSFIEKLFTKIRYEMLFVLGSSNKNNLKQYFDFIISLAEQSWLNEYIHTQSKKENDYISKLMNNIENDNDINELEIAILGCYIPLNSSKIIVNKLLNYKSASILFNDLITLQIKEPLKEKELVKSITTLNIIEDSVSKKVREQYEEHPYPRWRYNNKFFSNNFFKIINADIKPNSINHNNKFNNPSVLVAGCGTGSHSIMAARYKNADILAVDLSLASLAYAKRKTEELDYKNIEYLHADILQLKKFNRKFDIIESVGTLHHMKDPVEGLKVLLDILEPHGFLRLGLYSELARQSVVTAREFIKKKNYKDTSKDIKICRQDIFNQKEDPVLQEITHFKDFYSTSMVRDLLFHIQEHRFTILQISKILKDLNLEFLGFNISNSKSKIEYSKLFPNDKENISLDNWHQFEIDNPNTFISMYQFWVRKK